MIDRVDVEPGQAAARSSATTRAARPARSSRGRAGRPTAGSRSRCTCSPCASCSGCEPVAGLYQPLGGQDLRPARRAPRGATPRSAHASRDSDARDQESSTRCSPTPRARAVELAGRLRARRARAVPGDMRARRLPLPRDLPGVDMTRRSPPQQRAAIERRHGRPAARRERRAAARPRCSSSGSSAPCSRTASTSRADPHDHVHREGGRRAARPRSAGGCASSAPTRRRARTEGAYISTIHGFCARVLRAHALARRARPEFAVLDETEAERSPTAAFDVRARGPRAATRPGGVDLIAAHRHGSARARSSGPTTSCGAARRAPPALPPIPPPRRARVAAPTSSSTPAAAAAPGARRDRVPAARVQTALERLERCDAVLADADPWPGELDAPSRSPAATVRRSSTEACERTPRRSAASATRASTGARSERTRCSTGCCGCSASATERRKRDVSGARLRGPRAAARELLRRDARAPRALPRAGLPTSWSTSSRTRTRSSSS